jgi:hypothetical protein
MYCEDAIPKLDRMDSRLREDDDLERPYTKNDETNPFPDLESESRTQILLPLGEGARRADEGLRTLSNRKGRIVSNPASQINTASSLHAKR